MPGTTTSTTLYGIKNCDTVKKARRWLDEHQVSYQFHDFRSDGLQLQQVQSWLASLGNDKLINKRSTTWKQLSEQEKQQALSDQAAPLLVTYPTLIKRPLLAADQGVYTGFSEALYREINSQVLAKKS